MSNISSSENASSVASDPNQLADFDFENEYEVSSDIENVTSPNTDSTQMSTLRESAKTPDSVGTASVSSVETPQQSRKRSKAASQDHTDILREFLNRKQPNPMDFLPPKPPAPKDNLQQFFEAIASTMRTFPPLSVAKIKLQISQIVGQEEIDCAERNANVEIVYVENTIETETETEAQTET